MVYRLGNLIAYRFFEKDEGPLVTIRKYTKSEASEFGKRAGITNIQEIYNNRIMIENWLYRQFVKNGGKPQCAFPYYATVYDKLPPDNQLHVRFQKPQCICIPMSAFSKESVSFTYGQSPRALTRKDNHPTRRKVLTWDEAEWAINTFPYDKNEGTWLEMQIWEESVIRQFYNRGDSVYVKDCIVSERLSQETKKILFEKYSSYFQSLPKYLFVDCYSVHGISHAIRVLVLAEKIATDLKIEPQYIDILRFGALYHDIGRENDQIDDLHGYKSFEKLQKFKGVYGESSVKSSEILRFIIENHPLTNSQVMENIDKYSLTALERSEAMQLLFVLKDADALDRCRFGHIDLDYLTFKNSRKYVSLAYQLLTIFRENIV